MKPEIWGGIECTVNRVGGIYFDQIERNGHARRPTDLELFARLGIKTLRYPLLWEYVQPDSPALFDWIWSDARLNRLRELGIRPIAGLLHHGSGPRWTDLLQPRFPEHFSKFAAAFARRYPWVDAYTPINEPLTTARFCALYGHWHPHHKSNKSFVAALLNQIEATMLAMRAIREVNPSAILVQTEDLSKVYSTPSLNYQAEFENHRRWITIDLLTGRFDERHPLWQFFMFAEADRAQLDRIATAPCPPDISGANYYVTSERFLDHRVDLFPADTVGGNMFHTYADVAAVQVRDVESTGLGGLLQEAWDHCRIPLAVTEVHLGCTREEQLRWLVESWDVCRGAIGDGIDVRAITAWALLGAFDWNTLVTRQSGTYEAGAFDVRSPAPRPTALARAIHGLASVGSYSHPVLHTPGWWRRHSRFPGGQHSMEKDFEGAPPLLILGADGQLGQMLTRVCNVRGLAHRRLTHTLVDICDHRAVADEIRQYRPWAVINAAAHTSIDLAEREIDKCFLINIEAATNVAAICREHGVAYAAVSCDLVFDGLKLEPYTEIDIPAPLGIYGQSKQEMEARILMIAPDALIVRTSTIFSEFQFPLLTGNVLLGEEPILVPDCVVSPTYSPDLCNAMLDLLIDGESGIWHLANEGAIKLHDFTMLITSHFDVPASRIQCADCSAFEAPRPRRTILRSRRGRIMPSLDSAIKRMREEFSAALCRH